MKRNFFLILIIALSGVILGSLGVSWVFSGSNNSVGQVNDHGPAGAGVRLPIDVKQIFRDRERAYDGLGPNYLRVDEGFVDDTNSCDFCIAVAYKEGPLGKATFAFKSTTPIDLSKATIVTFAARGENSGEKMRIFAAGVQDISANDNGTDSGIRNVSFQIDRQITLTKDWTLYEMRLQGLDLKAIAHAFAFQIIGKGSDESQITYVDAIFYSDEHSDFATVLN